MRPDLQVTPVDWAGERLYVVKDPLALRYFHLPATQFAALEALQDCSSLSAWSERLTETPENPTLAQLRHWLQEFLQWGLVTRERWVERDHRLESEKPWWSHLARYIQNPLYLQFPGFDPSPWLDPLHRCCGWVLSTPGVCGSLLLALIIWLGTLTHFATFTHRLPDWTQLQHWQTWCSIWLAIGVTKIIHELVHGLAARRYGAECHALGFALILFSPALYCDVSDAWRLPRRWPRMAIALAGIWAETVLGASTLLMWWGTRPSLFHDWCWHVTAVSSIATLMINLNPLARYDGYFLLCDAFGLPNLRQQADAVVEQDLRQWVHGPQGNSMPIALPLRLRVGLWCYAAGSWVYRIMMIVSMGYGLATLLEPVGLEALTWIYAAMSLGSLAWLTVRRSGKIFANGSGPRRWLSAFGVMSLLVSVGWFATTVPIPWPESAMFALIPQEPQSVYVTTPGELIEIAVRPGERVAAGQLLAQLQNSELDRQRLNLLVSCAQQEQLVELARKQQQPGRQEEAQAALNTFVEQLAEIDRRRERLQLLAPCAGTVLPPDLIPEPQSSDADQRMPRWSGSPLEPANLGARLEPGTWLAQIVPDPQPRALVSLEQHQRPEVTPGMRCELQPTRQPRERWSGTVLEIAPRADQLSSLASSSSEPGATSKTYPTLVAIEADAATFPPGTTGLARFIGRPRTLWDRGLEAFRRAVPVVW